MAALLLIAFLAFALIALAVRRALPIAAACAAGWIVHQTIHDPLTACAVALATLALSSTILDWVALSRRPFVRWLVRGAETAGGVLVAMFLAWSFARAFGGEHTILQMAFICLSAGILGCLTVFSRYRSTL